MISVAFDSLRNRLSEQRHRALIWISGTQAECDRIAARLLGSVEGAAEGAVGSAMAAALGAGVLISDRERDYCPSRFPLSRTADLLGQTLPWAIYDAYSGFNPNAFAQLAGTIAAGGCLILLSPQADDWIEFSDPEYRKLRVEPWTVDMLEPNFLTRLVHRLDSDRGVLKLSTEGICPSVRLGSDLDRDSEPGLEPSVLSPPYMSLDQKRAVETVLAQSGKRRFALVLSADRGRGKSAAIGLALVEMARSRPLRVLITAPSQNALLSLYERIEAELGAIVWEGEHGRAGGLELIYLPPALAQERMPKADLVVIDEAAAIATPVLSRLSRDYKRLIFATTQHGYEGNGRGFTLRFLDELKRLVPQVRELRLETPIRWAPHDPLEKLVSSLLLLDAEPDLPGLPEKRDERVKEAPLRLETLQRDRLALDEVRLRRLFGLLILAHYRTTPGDLRVMLDSPNLDIHTLMRGDQLLGCALVAREGGLSSDLARGVWEGHRRPTGHLLPQALIAHEGMCEVAPWRAWRILRIAIHPELQQRGFGSHLLAALVERAIDEGVDYIGASFGATESLLRYWQGCGFMPVRVGEQLDPVSGCHSVMVLRALSQPSRTWLYGMRERYVQRLRYRLTGTLATLDSRLLPALFKGIVPPELTDREAHSLEGFARHRRSLESSLLELDKLLLATVQQWPDMGIGPDEQNLLVERIWRQKGAADIERPHGRNAQIALVRQLVGCLLASVEKPSVEKRKG